MKVVADFGKIEMEVLMDYVEHATVPPGHPLERVYGAIRKVFRKEVRRRRASYKKHRPATSVDLPLEGLSPEWILDVPVMVSALSHKMHPLKLYHGARFFQAAGLACRDLLIEKSEQLATLH